ncbi:N-terminal glutamine amidase-domain-containing protein [Auriculariales sp. MPI-PUGE-AT-0066]|nr:N-terminal glutamine amidase-domain-containing protein [Auriculariales sp. MPI-PUGE-AT-0066]
MIDGEFAQAHRAFVEPPAFPTPRIYTSGYCEENVYNLLRMFIHQYPQWRAFAVFISNPTKSVAVWEQRASSDPVSGRLVVWDYHVIAWLFPPSEDDRQQADNGITTPNSSKRSWIYDMDSTLQQPCLAREYLSKTFKNQTALELRWRSSFRIVSAGDYLENFASDRSHMLKNVGNTEEMEYIAPVPPYDPIRGPLAQVSHNLMSDFVCMEARSFGVVAKNVTEAFEMALSLASVSE